jgi:hypothetical protein
MTVDEFTIYMAEPSTSLLEVAHTAASFIEKNE